MQNDLEQVKALCGDAQGYLDKVMREAQDIASRADKLKAAAEEYDAIVSAIASAKADLALVKADYTQAERAFAAFKDLASKR